MAAVRFQGVVGKAGHALQLPRLDLAQAETIIEQRLAYRDGDGEIVRRHHRAEDARIQWRQLGIHLGYRAALHQEANTLVEGTQQPFQVFTVIGQHIEGYDHPSGRARGDDAALMPAEEVLVLMGIGAARGAGHLGGAGRPGMHRAEAGAGQGQAGGAEATQQAATVDVGLIGGRLLHGVVLVAARPRAGATWSRESARAWAAVAMRWRSSVDRAL